MNDRFSMAVIEVMALDGAALGVEVSHVMRGSRLMCSMALVREGAPVIDVAAVDGSIRMFAGLGEAMKALAIAAPSSSGEYALTVRGAALMVTEPPKVGAARIAELQRLIAASTAAHSAMSGKVLMLSDIPNMYESLEDEVVVLSAELARLQAG